MREAIGNVVGVDNAKFSITVAKSIGNEEELSKASQDVHVLYANVYDNENTITIYTDRTSLLGAMDCPQQKQRIFLMVVHDTSKRVLDFHHNITKEDELNFEWGNTKLNVTSLIPDTLFFIAHLLEVSNHSMRFP